MLCPPTLSPRITSPLPVHPICSTVSMCIIPVLPAHLTTLFQRRHLSRHDNVSPNIQLFSVIIVSALTAPIKINYNPKCTKSRGTYTKLLPHKRGPPKLQANQSRYPALQHQGTLSVSVSCWGGRDDPPGQPSLSPANDDQWHKEREKHFKGV